jgi:hypothetical protein
MCPLRKQDGPGTVFLAHQLHSETALRTAPVTSLQSS